MKRNKEKTRVEGARGKEKEHNKNNKRDREKRRGK